MILGSLITTSLICIVVLLATGRQARSRASHWPTGWAGPGQNPGRPNTVSVPLFGGKIAQQTPGVKQGQGVSEVPWCSAGLSCGSVSPSRSSSWENPENNSPPSYQSSCRFASISGCNHFPPKSKVQDCTPCIMQAFEVQLRIRLGVPSHRRQLD